MVVGWLADRGTHDGMLGGAEYTAQELLAAKPEGVEVVDCPPGAVTRGLDVYVVHNCWTYTRQDLRALRDGPVVRFVHDHRGPGPVDASSDKLRIFYSPLQRDRVGLAGHLIPAPIDLERFAPPEGVERSGPVTIGTFGHMGKGPHLLAEWAQRQGETLVIYGHGPCVPQAACIDYRGPIAPEAIPATLWQFRRFVHLPTEVEAFGRGVVEAWAAGCELVINENCGCLHWIRNDPAAIETAAAEFWGVVLDG